MSKDTKKGQDDKATVHGVIARLKGMLVTGTNVDQVQAYVDELVAEHGEAEVEEPAVEAKSAGDKA